MWVNPQGKIIRSAIGIGKCIFRRVGAKKSMVEREALWGKCEKASKKVIEGSMWKSKRVRKWKASDGGAKGTVGVRERMSREGWRKCKGEGKMPGETEWWGRSMWEWLWTCVSQWVPRCVKGKKSKEAREGVLGWVLVAKWGGSKMN